MTLVERLRKGQAGGMNMISETESKAMKKSITIGCLSFHRMCACFVAHRVTRPWVNLWSMARRPAGI